MSDAPDFPDIRRMADPRFPHEIAAILPGQYFASRESMIVYTVLGSCVSACIRDPLVGVGGMNHFMLPAPAGDAETDGWGQSERYGCYAMEMLTNAILARGGHRSRLEVKVFGGGRIYEHGTDVGKSNADWVLRYLEQEGLRPAKQDLGDVYPRKLYYFTSTGVVLLKRIVRLKNRTIMEREEQYQQTLREGTQTGAVTLF